MSKRKLNSLPIKEKLKLISAVESGEKRKLVAEKFNIAQSTLSGIIKDKGKILAAAESTGDRDVRRIRPLKYEAIDSAMIKWFHAMRAKNLPISGNELKAKALQFADTFNIEGFRASEGWLDKFKKRQVACV